MIEILCNCFNSLKIYFVLIIGFLLYLNNKKLRDEFNKKQIEDSIESIERRSEECPQQYLNGWLPVYDSHDLKKGDVKPIFALGRDLVIYRGTSGKVYLFDAYCPHLGANLGVGGTVVGDDIKCHFHGWQFNNQGYCNSIPGLEEKAIPKTRIKKWRCDDVNDFIYVWHHLEEKEPDWFMPKMDETRLFNYQGKIILKSFCHIQDICDNEADQWHFPALHNTENTITYYLQKLIKFETIFNSWKTCDAPNNHCSVLEVKLYTKIGFLALPSVKLISKQIGPNHFNTELYLEPDINKKLIINNNIMTVGPFKQLMSFKVYYKPDILGYILSKLAMQLFSKFLDPDVKVWNRKRFLRKPTFTKLDEMNIQYRRWLKQFY